MISETSWPAAIEYAAYSLLTSTILVFDKFGESTKQSDRTIQDSCIVTRADPVRLYFF